ncbi:MAG TPA: geranylgeranyl reductase family protein [Leptolyngbyaceae cyanobacterium M33_DOE_097]|uniref:Geranylgeranyl reductase family protein n=1 Tax=Oscillatoriales cyanobacterium SpSt-418 TaxID=2282169 RepID=A0A7C3KH66_9CYAN|nr:geranylgeranyl reductase family protein [Leptolyngbyaceae cyanobacterium M33_DOE_097]
MHYDLIVCGAGPAGATAATIAAAAGLKVALLEKYPLPRHKTCGGGMPLSVQSLLYELAPDAVVESDVTQIRHTWKFDDAYLGLINPPGTKRLLSIWMVQRSVFDAALANQAVQAGADLQDGLVVQAVEVEGDRVRVTARGLKSGHPFVATANTVIGADGATSVTAQSVNLQRSAPLGLAMEIELPYEWQGDHPYLRPEIAHLEYAVVKNGYAWIFPKRDHLNVGAGVFRFSRKSVYSDREVPGLLRRVIADYLKALQIPFSSEKLRFHAHPLPIWTGKSKLQTADGKVLLAGDAAGLINPLFGDGILHAIKSGAIAAQSVIDDKTKVYSDLIHAEFAPDFNASLRLAGFFYQYPGIAFRVMAKHPYGSRMATQLLMGDMSFAEISDRAIGRIRQALIGKFVKA